MITCCCVVLPVILGLGIGLCPCCGIAQELNCLTQLLGEGTGVLGSILSHLGCAALSGGTGGIAGCLPGGLVGGGGLLAGVVGFVELVLTGIGQASECGLCTASTVA